MNSKLYKIGWRLLQAVPSILGVIIISFVLTRTLPGDPAVYFAGAMADKESIEQVRQALGLDRSWIEQFFIQIFTIQNDRFGDIVIPFITFPNF